MVAFRRFENHPELSESAGSDLLHQVLLWERSTVQDLSLLCHTSPSGQLGASHLLRLQTSRL